jgi:hypothetical protein
MRALALCFGLGLLAVGVPAHAADQVINMAKFTGVSAEDLRTIAEYSFTKRRYNIEENTAALVVGELESKRVEIVIEPQRVVIRWKEGFAGKNDLWLRNLKTDLLWRLVE